MDVIENVIMDNIKQEFVDIEIKHEEVCFELIEEAGSYVIDGIKDESLLSNETEKENDTIEQSKIMEFIHVNAEENWTEPVKYVSDPLAFLPAVQTEVETKSTEDEHTTTIDASPSTSQGIDVLFLCAKCGSKFTSYDEHHKHIESCSYTNSHINTEDKPFKCTQCNYSTTEKDYLKRHVKVHSEEKPFKCLQCNYSTIKRCNLKNHTRVHTGEKPFKCSQCDYTAAFQSSIKSHTRVHTGEKPYKCAECDYSTVKPCFLKIHSRVHTGERPYKCLKCDYSARDKGCLKRHLKVHIPEKPQTDTNHEYCRNIVILY